MRARLRKYVQAALPVSWRFSMIYRNRWWGGVEAESASGQGSSLEATEKIRSGLPRLLNALECTTLFDLGCGDFNWMRHVKLDVPYIGADIVEPVIEANRANFGRRGVRFIGFDGIKDPIPGEADIVLCRELLFHLSFRHAIKTLRNIKRSNARYLIATQIDTGRENRDSYTGGFRPLDLTRAPFHLPQPVFRIDDDAVDQHRSLAAWTIAEIPDF